MSRRPHTRQLFAVCLGLGLLAWTGCTSIPAEAKGRPPISTGRVLDKAEVRQLVPRVYVGDERYAEVNSRWLMGFYPHFRAELFRLGVVRWDTRFDCNRLAELYTGVAQVAYFNEAFHSGSSAQALAVGPFWYLKADGRGHAIVQALTELGPIFIDPQTGKRIELTAKERASAFLQVI